VIEGSTIAAALPQDSLPAQACLNTLQDEELEEGSIIMNWYPPFKIMIGNQGCSACPLTTVHFTSILYDVRLGLNTSTKGSLTLSIEIFVNRILKL
jgi:hypothetical protein